MAVVRPIAMGLEAPAGAVHAMPVTKATSAAIQEDRPGIGILAMSGSVAMCAAHDHFDRGALIVDIENAFTDAIIPSSQGAGHKESSFRVATGHGIGG